MMEATNCTRHVDKLIGSVLSSVYISGSGLAELKAKGNRCETNTLLPCLMAALLDALVAYYLLDVHHCNQ